MGAETICAARPHERLCENTPCGVRFHLELIPGTDAPVADPRDARIADLEAKLSALESAKPLAVLPEMPDVAILRNAESWTTIWWTSRPKREAVEDMMVKYPDAIREDLYLAKNIQPVDPDLLAALDGSGDTFCYHHDGMLFFGSKRKIDDLDSEIGGYIDRLGNLQRILRASLYGDQMAARRARLAAGKEKPDA